MELFEPNLALAKEPDGEYTLYSVTLTPNSCFSAGNPIRCAPPGVMATPETIVYQLPLLYSDGGFCLQVITPVRHEVQNIRFDAAHNRLLAFTMLDGKIVGRASISPDDLARLTILDDETVERHARAARFSATVTAPAATAAEGLVRPDLTADVCFDICVASTPKHPDPASVDGGTQLHQLDVVNDVTARVYRSGVRSRLNAIGWQIQPGTIAATPQTTINQSAMSVEGNAF
jgi:hypothetical protein